MNKVQQSDTGWHAWVNLMPGHSTLHVTGGVSAPNTCYKEASLVPDDGAIVTPETVPLKLAWSMEGSKCLMIVTPRDVHYTAPFLGGKTSVLISFPNGSKLSLPIEEAE